MIKNDINTLKSTIGNNIPNNINDIIFQVSDWDYYHEDSDIVDETIKKYVIRIYGTTKDNKKIFVKVKNYTPYFYVEIPKHWSKQKVQILIDTVKKEVTKYKSECVNSLKTWELVDKNIFWEFTNYKIFTFVRLIFHSYEGFRAYERVFNRTIKNILLDTKPKKYKLFESNIEPMLRCMHIRKINAVGWIKISGGKYNFFSSLNNPSTNEICIYTDWTNLDPIDDKTIAPLIVAAFDIECTSSDGTFPQPQRDGDKVIQIGTTFSRYGEDECFYKHIITLGSCDNIEGVDVESYNNEVKVLLAWTELIKRTNPDIVTGYNIFGFDYKYLEERAKKLGCYNSFSKLGRIKNEISPFINKELISAAMGDNKLYYYAMQGRVQIDIMKVIMRDFKLGSYKLDNVAAEFIKDEIVDINVNIKNNTTTIKTKNTTYGLEKGRYIKISFNDGLSDNSYKNETKFKVLSIDTKSFIISDILDGEALEIKKFKVYWSQAKDDVHAKDIFRLQKGSAADRSIIARYCIFDCVLCNKLINKLQIITNNVGMANVCHVPLSYIFLRGQGIKIFSLVSKKCREKNHVIPVIRKPYKPKENNKLPPNIAINKQTIVINKKDNEINKKDNVINEEEDKDGYEGATVFDPHIGIHYEPITVLDYNSLYPNSMRFRNISHECIIKDKKYDNLPGYYYENVSYANKDGTTTTCRYARAINGPLGILPEILTELLNARSEMKELAEKEKDPFKQKILDGLQLAMKVTANSLYGQTGSKVSPISMKDLAASTTSTGRSMLNCAKIFVQVIFPILVNSILFENYESYEKNINLLFQKKIDELIGQENVNILKKKNEMIDIWGKQMLNDDGNVIIEEAKYEYLDIFKNNRDPINDKKFIWKNKEGTLKHSCKNDFIKWLHEEITKLLIGKYTIKPIVIYGDSVDEKECLMLLNNKNQIEFLKIGELCNQWEKYNNFKTDEHNEYFMNIINQLSVKQIDTDKLSDKLPFTIKKKLNNLNFLLEEKKDDKIDEYIEELKQLLIEDQKNRFSKEQSKTNYKIYTDEGWKCINRVIRHKTNKKMFRIVTTTSIIDITEDHSLIDINSNYLTPKECIIGTELLHGFPNNIHEYELNIKNEKNYDTSIFINSDKVECMKYYCISKKLGYNVKIDIINDDFVLNRTKEKVMDLHKIIKIIQLDDINEDKYVYDLECENGKFNAGIGEITVKNTDSIFINYQIRDNGKKLQDKESLIVSMELGKICEKILHKVLPIPQNMGYEKVFLPLALLSKKRYVGNKYEFDPNKYYQNSMGIVLKRRDNAPIVKIVVGGIVKSILNDKNPNKAIEYARKTLKDILSGKFALEKFIITKTLKGNALTHSERILENKKPKEERIYADRSRIVHAVLADRIADRDPGNRPQSNERIPYIYILTNKDVSLQGEKVEHPDYIIENDIPLDYLFYITNQIMKPSLQFLEHITNNASKLFEKCIIKEMNRRTGKRPLSYYFNILNQLKNDDPFGDFEDNDDFDDSNEMDIFDNNKNLSKEFSCYNDSLIFDDEIKKSNIKKNNIKKKNKNNKSSIITNFDKGKNGFILDL